MVALTQDIGRPAAADAGDAFETLFGTLIRSHDVDEAEALAGQVAHVLGFAFFSYVLPKPLAGDDGRGGAGMLLTSYPADWKNRYRRRSYETEDTVIVEGRHARLPFHWGDDSYLRRIGPTSRRLFFEARDFGILNGFTVPVHGPHGECGLFSVASPDPLEDGAQPLSGSRYRALCATAQHLHATVMTRRAGVVQDPRPALTEHERVCLVWTARGKTSWEIGQIIGRSKATVDFHIRRASRKLDAANKIHAASRALQLDLL